MKALIIDLSSVNEIKILNCRISGTVNIISGYFMATSAEEDPLIVTATKLKEEGLSKIPAFIIPPGDLVQHQTFLLPKMPDKELKKVLPRQIAESKDTDEPMIFNFMDNGPAEDRQGEKVEIAAFFCPKEEMFEFLNRLKEEDIQTAKIIPEAQALKTLVEINPEMHTGKTGSVLLDLMGNRINLNIFKSTYWGLDREFLFRMEGGAADDLTDEDFSRISTELNRTFQYFKQRNRTFNIEQVLLYGSSSNLEPLKNLINDNLPVPASQLKSKHFQGKISMPGHLKMSAEFLPIFTVTIAAAIAVTNKKCLDLYPPEYKEKAKLPTRLIGLGISAALIAAILAGSTFYFESIKTSYKEDIETLNRANSTLSKNAVVVKNTKEKRALFYKQRFYNDFPVQYSYSASDFIRRVGLVVTEDIELQEIEINPKSQTFTFVLKGRIKADNNIEAQSGFLRFFQRLKGFEDIIHVDSSDVNVNPGNKKRPLPTYRKRNRPGTGQNKKQVELYFTINGEVEPQ
jgi:hypothetical protein